ncbi:hypothetical protein DK130_02295 [Fructilactobacillus sanfranciscensis]|nr:hypothetical protein DK130_02295 [Fructilactobacillus sanfranciscensis]
MQKNKLTENLLTYSYNSIFMQKFMYIQIMKTIAISKFAKPLLLLILQCVVALKLINQVKKQLRITN